MSNKMPETLKLPAEAEIIIEGCQRIGQLAEAILELTGQEATWQSGHQILVTELNIEQSALTTTPVDGSGTIRITKPRQEFAQTAKWLYSIEYLMRHRDHSCNINLCQADHKDYPGLMGFYNRDPRPLILTDVTAIKTDLYQVLRSLGAAELGASGRPLLAF